MLLILFDYLSIAKDELTYILATDADVKFTAEDVMALMDLMSRSPRVGAVCGRTHPMGNGPMVWYCSTAWYSSSSWFPLVVDGDLLLRHRHSVSSWYNSVKGIYRLQ